MVIPQCVFLVNSNHNKDMHSKSLFLRAIIDS
jgi:hypothetical protein